MRTLWSAVLCGALACADAQAVVTRIVIDNVDAPTFDARDFGAVGRYEKLSGKAFGEIDPADPLNAGITYIQDAPRNERGRVEYVIDISILKPIESSRGNGTLLYDVVNRGARRAFEVFHLGAAGRQQSVAARRHRRRVPDAPGVYAGRERLAGRPAEERR